MVTGIDRTRLVGYRLIAEMVFLANSSNLSDNRDECINLSSRLTGHWLEQGSDYQLGNRVVMI